MWLLMILVIYVAIGAIVWFTEDIRFTAGWREFIAWPVIVIAWGDELVEWLYKIMKDKFGDG